MAPFIAVRFAETDFIAALSLAEIIIQLVGHTRDRARTYSSAR